MSRHIKGKYKTFEYFIVLVIVLAIQLISICAMNAAIKKRVLDGVEARYHAVDKAFGKTVIGVEDDEAVVESFYGSDDSVYVAVTDTEGNVIVSYSGKDVSIGAPNILQYLSTAKSSDLTDVQMKDIFKNGTSGRFVFYGGNQSKVLIYTNDKELDGHTVVRIMPKRVFNANKDGYGASVNHATVIIVFLDVVIFLIAFFFFRFAAGLESSNARNSLIAEDNDLISFTYHPSIASFEVTGAVEKAFGEEIGKRSHIDWNTLSRLIHPDDQALLRNISKAIKTKDSKYTSEFRIVDKDGNYHWYRINGKSIQAGNDVTKFVGTIQNSDDQITHENMLKNKAEHDLLTGLLNKITMEELVNEAINSSGHSVYAFYIVDLDNFKAVNDNLGHAVGDKVLTDVASKLQLVFNEADYIGRLGGDEFSVLLVIPSMMTSQADKLIKEKATLLNDIMRAEYGDENITINVSASIGIAVYPEEGGDFHTLYQHADKALYHSKEHGKNQYTFYKDVM